MKTHVSSILAKLGVADRTQAALFAVRHGLARRRVLGLPTEARTGPRRPMWRALPSPYVRSMEQNQNDRPVALITGASRGLGRALAGALADRGWALVIDARGADALHRAARALARVTTVGRPARGRGRRGATAPTWSPPCGDSARLDALVHNASVLGPSPQPALADYPAGRSSAHVYEVNVLAPAAADPARPAAHAAPAAA